jgi:hypothetical protein
MPSIPPRSKQWANQLVPWLDEIFIFVRNLLGSCTLGAAGIFTLQHLPDLLVSFGKWQPRIVGGTMAAGGFVLAMGSCVRLVYGSLKLLRVEKLRWLEMIFLLVVSYLTISAVTFTYVAIGMKSAR